MGKVSYNAEVLALADVRDNAAGRHDMGNLSAGTVIHVVEEYIKDGVLWLRFDKPNMTQPGYDETWCLSSAVSVGTVGAPPVTPPSSVTTLTLRAGESVKITIERLPAS